MRQLTFASIAKFCDVIPHTSALAQQRNCTMRYLNVILVIYCHPSATLTVGSLVTHAVETILVCCRTSIVSVSVYVVQNACLGFQRANTDT